MRICGTTPSCRSHPQRWLIQRPRWISRQRPHTNADGGNTRSTRRRGTRTQHLYQTEERSSCTTTATLDQLPTGSGHLEGEGVEAGRGLGALMRPLSMFSLGFHGRQGIYANPDQPNSPTVRTHRCPVGARHARGNQRAESSTSTDWLWQWHGRSAASYQSSSIDATQP